MGQIVLFPVCWINPLWSFSVVQEQIFNTLNNVLHFHVLNFLSLPSLHSCRASGQSLRTELLPKENLDLAESKSSAAPCWPNVLITMLSQAPHTPPRDFMYVFVAVLSRCVGKWRPSCAAYIDSVSSLTFLSTSPLVCRNEPRPWCSAYEYTNSYFKLILM